MKNLQIVFNLFVACVLGLLLWQVNVEKDEVNIPFEAEEDTLVTPVKADQMNIRYINSDSVWAHYDLVKSLRSNLESKQKQYQNNLESQAKQFEQEVIDFQQNAGSMSQFEGQQKQQYLLNREQELGKLQQDLANKLMEMEDKMQKEIRESVIAFLDSYKSKGINMVIDYSSNSSTLMISDSLNITDEVIIDLNANYQALQKK